MNESGAAAGIAAAFFYADFRGQNIPWREYWPYLSFRKIGFRKMIVSLLFQMKNSVTMACAVRRRARKRRFQIRSYCQVRFRSWNDRSKEAEKEKMEQKAQVRTFTEGQILLPLVRFALPVLAALFL